MRTPATPTHRPTGARRPCPATPTWLALALGVAGLAATALVASATPAGALTHVVAPPNVGTSTLGLGGWRVQSSAVATQGGPVVSSPGFSPHGWLTVHADGAGAPGTEIGALLENGACPNVFFSTTMSTCFGDQRRIGRDTVPRFAVPWWFRTEFSPDLRAGETATLIVNGVVGQADVWIDGHRVASQAVVEGAYTRYRFDVTSLLGPGTNALALEVYPNDPRRMYTLDDVDWNQIPPDNNTGLQFPVQLQIAAGLSLDDLHVSQSDTPDLHRAALTIIVDVVNLTPAAVTAEVTADVTGPTGQPVAHVATPVTLGPKSTAVMTFTPSAFPNLDLANPSVWWPYQMGGQPLYGVSAEANAGGRAASAPTVTFGIRTLTSWLTPPSALAPDGVRVFAVNGVPILVRGAGWAEDLFLRYSSQDVANQISLIKSLGLNVVRTEGKEMPGDFYDQMDRAGILVDAGFQCCDKWQPADGGRGLTAHDDRILYLSALTIGQRLRDHPSVMNYSWSDNAPVPEQERVSLQGFTDAGFDQPLIASAEYKSSPRLGPSGEKEGPYDWVPPSYWYDTSHRGSDPTLTNVGGAWGFDSEESAGDTVPTIDSIQRFLSPADQTNLSTDPAFHQYHTNDEPGHRGYRFGTLFNFDAALAARYGPWSDLATFVDEAQVQNYEDTRAQFEAFIDHWGTTNSSTGTPPATGTIYWMLNKGWPTLLWDLYNDDGDLPGAFFGAQEANRPLHVLYAYDDGTVAVDNLGSGSRSGLTVESKVYDLAGDVVDDQTRQAITIGPQGVDRALLAPRLPSGGPARVSFIELTLWSNGSVIDRNVYWVSTRPDEVRWNRTVGNPQATMARYADLSSLHDLPPATVAASATTGPAPGAPGTSVTSVTLTDTSTTGTVAFFVRADVRRGTVDGSPLPGDNAVLPITWSANDVTLWPGESVTVTAAYPTALLDTASPVVSVTGWNVAPLDVLAG